MNEGLEFLMGRFLQSLVEADRRVNLNYLIKRVWGVAPGSPRFLTLWSRAEEVISALTTAEMVGYTDNPAIGFEVWLKEAKTE